jgi:hypothetical protein
VSYEAEPTYQTALKLWWAMVWRFVPVIVICIVVASIAIGVVSAMIGVATGMEKEQVQNMGAVAGFFVGLVLNVLVSIWLIRRLMTKGFGRFRLAVMVK